MPWTHSQSIGQLSHDGSSVGQGCSGHGPGRNNSDMETVHGVGPTPRGSYQIGSPHHSRNTGNYSMNLDPQAGTNTWGRTLLRMHGDNRAHPGEASDGCVILPLQTRQSIWSSGDHVLQVVP